MSILSPQSWRKRNLSHRNLDQKLVGSLSTFKIPRVRQLKYLPRLLSRREYFVLKLLIAICIVNIGFLGWNGYRALTVEVPKKGGTYTEGLVGSPQYISPLFLGSNESDRDLVGLIYSGLTAYTSNHTLAMDLAERYTVDKTGTQYTFFLRNGVKWHDGTFFTADDVVFTINSIKDPKTKSTLFQSYKDVAVKKIDDHTVQFILPKPFALFLDLTSVPIMPQHVWKGIGPGQLPLSIYDLKPIGTGPWKFKSFQKDSTGTILSYTIVRNEDYYGHKPIIGKIIFKWYPDTQSVVEGLKNRYIEGASFLSQDDRAGLAKDTGLTSYPIYLPEYTSLFFNPAHNNVLSSLSLRRALAALLDKQKIVDQGMNGEARVIDAPIPQGFIGYDADIPKISYDVNGAKQTLADAGWKQNDKGMLVATDRKGKKTQLSLQLATVDTPQTDAVADQIKQMWESVGIVVTINHVAAADIQNTVIDPRSYDVLLYGTLLGSDPDLYPFWHSSQKNAPGLNLSGFADKTADSLLEAARQEQDSQKRGELYKQFQTIISQQMPAVFLYSPTYSYIMTKDVKGVPSAFTVVYPSDRFADLSQWYVESARVFK